MIKKNGFTLVEVLVVMAIVAVIGTVLVAIFTNTLRGNVKSQILSVIKQNGQVALGSMDKTIREADGVVCVSLDGNTVVVITDGKYTRFRFVPENNTDAAVGNCGNLTGSANGCIQQDFPVQPQPPPIDPKNDINVFLAAICTDTDPMGTDSVPAGTFQTLTDTNLQTGVSVQNIPSESVFSVSSQAGLKDNVTIRFQLAAGVGVPPAISGQIDPVEFQTSVQLR